MYWKREADRTAIAVTNEAPYSIRIIEPKVPLVQRGSMNLKIVAERKAGFTAPITIYPLFNPPGVGSASSVTIAGNQKETVLPMNAAANAQVRKWKTAVLGVATVGNGPVWVSSQLATLEIAPPFVTFAMERAASEQGKNIEMFCKVRHNTPFAGAAKVRLVGLPPKATAADVEITKDTKEIVFKVTVDKASPPGQHRNIFCQVVVTQNGEPILHNVGGTELRIDVPLPPKVVAAPKPAAPKPQPSPACQAAGKTPHTPGKTPAGTAGAREGGSGRKSYPQEVVCAHALRLDGDGVEGCYHAIPSIDALLSHWFDGMPVGSRRRNGRGPPGGVASRDQLAYQPGTSTFRRAGRLCRRHHARCHRRGEGQPGESGDRQARQKRPHAAG